MYKKKSVVISLAALLLAGSLVISCTFTKEQKKENTKQFSREEAELLWFTEALQKQHCDPEEMELQLSFSRKSYLTSHLSELFECLLKQ